ncbi:LytR/AlgR family response regulator transcription factor [Taibaiella chishuiensis]|uniref:LytTR family two component transcriptional regulator n=1 Tax=Taibaiella chishuiensis TaxID=1434707 RepID=A0A2P8D4U0_9BACT|nr:LytTR family DNA-binding domain-containing protein [Taibaiella chishuiensis]PSK92230.1 LytTR family two component transcriptional regulator [Taibaiella chishuiensis]
MIKVVIIDDKGTNVKTLEVLLKDYCPDVTVLASATGVDTGYQCILQHRPDVVFLDIELIHESGFELVRKFGSPFFEIIFTTAYSQYALDAFKIQAVDYLLKPIGIAELQAALQKAEQKITLKQASNQLLKLLDEKSKSQQEKIALPTLQGYKFVDQKDIVYCKAAGSYTYFFFTGGQRELVSTGIGLCEQLLAAPVFFRVHHSFIVNLGHIDKYVKGRGGYLVLDEGTHIDVSISRKDEFLKLIGH